MNKFTRYAGLLVEWQARMNLVGPATLPDLWSRHFRDSAQLVPIGAGKAGRLWLDIGSGAGFPPLVIALLTDATLHLVESTAKKCAFLQVVVSECEIANATVHNARIESLPRFPADIISARACAPLAKLFAWGHAFSTPQTRWILPKGARHAEEIYEAKQQFSFETNLVSSRTDPSAAILVATLDMRDDR